MRRPALTPFQAGADDRCHACPDPIEAGQWATLIHLGPGGDPTARSRARAGLPYPPVTVAVHWPCATGEPHPAGPGVRANHGNSRDWHHF
jgi:hypothetical protein